MSPAADRDMSAQHGWNARRADRTPVGARQLGAPRPLTAREKRRAARWIASSSASAAECAEALALTGLTAADGLADPGEESP